MSDLQSTPALLSGGILLQTGRTVKNNLSASIKTLFTVLFWGASFVAVKIGLKYVPSITLVWIRFAVVW
jgi:hypothetical protein